MIDSNLYFLYIQNFLHLSHKYFYDVVLLAVAHDLFCDKDEKYWKSIVKEDGLIFDLKGIIPRELVTLRL